MIQVEIRNDRTGTDELGNYDVRVLLPGEGWVEARVEQFDRRQGFVALATAAAIAAERVVEARARARVAEILAG